LDEELFSLSFLKSFKTLDKNTLGNAIWYYETRLANPSATMVQMNKEMYQGALGLLEEQYAAI